MPKALLRCFEVSLVLVAAMLVLGQVLTPALARDLAEGQPEAVPHVTLYSALAIAALLCVEVILVCAGRLAALLADGRFPPRSAESTLGVIAVFAVAAAVLALVALLHLILISRIGGPLPVLLCFGAVLAGISTMLGALYLRRVLALRTAGADQPT